LFLAEYNHQEGEALFPDDVIMGNFDRQPQPED
jgi:hypothetical protein